MGDGRRGGIDANIWIRITTGECIEEEAITVDFHDSISCSCTDTDKSTIGIFPTSLTERFGNDFRARFRREMNDFCSCFCLLPSARKGDTDVTAGTTFSLQNRARIEHRHARSEVTTNPLNESTLFDDSAFRIEVIGINRPILDR